MKLAIVTTAAPPSPNGQARVLGHLFGSQTFDRPIYLTDQMNILEADEKHLDRYHELSPAQFRLTTKPWGRALPGINQGGGLIRTVLTRATEIVAALRHESIDVVIGCSGNPFDLPASYLAARRLRLPFLAYLFDDPVYQWEAGKYRSFARLCEQIWGRGAAAIITPNEVLAADVKARLSFVHPHVVRNPVDPAAFGSRDTPLAQSTQLTPGDVLPWRLLYAGSVYSAQASSFRNLVAALNILQGQFVLDIYTAQFSSALVSNELLSPHVFPHPHVSHSTAIELFRDADILFLPLAFESPIPEVIRSSAPAKLGEYLAAGRPILVHAPAGSFVSEFIRDASAGMVVDTPDPHRLAEALTLMASDVALRERLVRNATNLAEEFDVERARSTLSSVLFSVKNKCRA
jgi:glycosyltransferase involved in cell wall biosynthesis